jgi:uncharacterized protein YdaL
VTSTGDTSRRLRAFGVVATFAALVCLVGSGGAGAGRWEAKPPKPTSDIPSVAGLAGPIVASQSGSTLTGTSTATGTSSIAGSSDLRTLRRGSVSSALHNGAPGAIGSSALILYDTTNSFGWLGELYATAVGNLASHFGTWRALPVAQYQAGQIAQYTATIYIGSTYDEPLPTAFLDDVYTAARPVIWIYDNIWELTNRYSTTFQSKYGWMWWQFDTSPVSQVTYKGVTLSRDGVNNQAGIMNYVPGSVDTTKATPLAYAVRNDGSTFPWALRSGSLTYIGENPFVYSGETDRLRAFEDLLYDALNPFAQQRHRAILRLEDIDPTYDPADLKAAADYLYSQRIPYGFGVSPVYTDPLGAVNNGVPTTVRMRDRAARDVVNMIKYMQARGGTLIMHGYTHQYSNVRNPYNGVTGDDFEFYRTVENPDHTLSFLGPVPEDSASWATGRINASFTEFNKSGISAPTIFEFPHYAGSAVDYQVVNQIFSTRWERVLYFGGFLSGGTIDYTHVIGQMFPYLIRDAYGTIVLPENLGNYEPEPFHQFPIHVVDDVLAAGRAESVVRDGVAGVYYHPFQGATPLQQIVDGLRAQGWTFSSPTQLAANG